jgi:LuxR family maltose regulon positive regulatory protein
VKPSDAVVGLLNPLPVFRARLALANAEVDTAAQWTRLRGLCPDDPPRYSRESEYLVLARVLLARQAAERALAMLERWTELATAQGRIESSIELGALQALALAACGDQEIALAALAEALTLAAGEGYVRVFADEGAPLAALLGKLIAAGTAPLPRPYLERLVQAFERQGLMVLPRPRPGGAIVLGLVEPLSARELEVLRLLATGRPNRPSLRSWWSAWTPSSATSATCSPNLGWPTAPKRSPEPGTWDCCPSSTPAAPRRWNPTRRTRPRIPPAFPPSGDAANRRPP